MHLNKEDGVAYSTERRLVKTSNKTDIVCCE